MHWAFSVLLLVVCILHIIYCIVPSILNSVFRSQMHFCSNLHYTLKYFMYWYFHNASYKECCVLNSGPGVLHIVHVVQYVLHCTLCILELFILNNEFCAIHIITLRIPLPTEWILHFWILLTSFSFLSIASRILHSVFCVLYCRPFFFILFFFILYIILFYILSCTLQRMITKVNNY